MHIKTMLNRMQNFKSFVYGPVRWVGDASEPTIEAEQRSWANSRAICSGYGRRRAGYDTRPVRRFEFIPMWGIKVFFVYAARRVSCRRCGIRVERMPWCIFRPIVNTHSGSTRTPILVLCEHPFRV